MAEHKDTGLKDLEKEITCAICHEHYTDPKVLSCCHYYCKQCILSIAKKTGLDKPFSCPECRKDTTLPQGGVDKLQGAFFVNRLKQVHSKLERATGEVEAKCELCLEVKANAYCEQCEKFVCAECVKSHRRMPVAFPNHNVVTMKELKEGGAKEIVTPKPTLQTCKVHDELMKMFCFNCNCLICRDCIVKDHKSHNYEFVKEAAPKVKKKLIQQLEPLKGAKANVGWAVKDVRATRSELEAEERTVVQRIEKWCDELCQIIQHHKKQLTKEAKGKTTQKLGGLSGQEDGLSTLCVRADSVIEFTQHCMKHSTDDQIMCMHAELQSRIARAMKEHRKAELEPVEEVDVAVEVSGVKELKRLCATKAKITQSLPMYTVDWKVPVSVLVDEESMVEATVHTELANGRSVKRTPVIEFHLKTPNRKRSSTRTRKVDFDRITDHRYRIWFTPTVEGDHVLFLTVNGVEEADSHRHIIVSHYEDESDDVSF